MYIFFSADKVCPCQPLLKLPLVLLFLYFDLLQQLEMWTLVLTSKQLQMTLAEMKLNSMFLCIIMNIEKMHLVIKYVYLQIKEQAHQWGT